MKSLKLCYQNEIHRISKPPSDYQGLLQVVNTIFKSNLPSLFSLQYEDSDGDCVTICNDEDLNAMIEDQESLKTIKIFVKGILQNLSSNLVRDEPVPESIQKAKLTDSSSKLSELRSNKENKVRVEKEKNEEKHQQKKPQGSGLQKSGLETEKKEEKVEEAKVNMLEKEKELEDSIPKDDNKGALMNLTLLRQVNCIPVEISVNDKTVYITVQLKNTGRVQWPKGALLRNIDGFSDQDAQLAELQPGDEFKSLVILQNPRKVGNLTSTWRLVYCDENGIEKFAGRAIEISFTVNTIQESAKKMKEIFPDVEMNVLLEFVRVNARLNHQELINKYLESF